MRDAPREMKIEERNTHEELNFWQKEFRALSTGELLLFKLHAPQNFIVGCGIFPQASNIPL
jgi:putative restriction endonuclease